MTQNRKPRVLIYDIETAPNLGYVWGKWDQNVVSFTQQWFILSFAYKWLGQKMVYSVSMQDFEDYKPGSCDDKHVVVELATLFDQADMTVTHNGKSFDDKKARSRMLVHGLDPPSPYEEIDTLRVARRAFAFTSNSLDDLCQLLGLPRKKQTGGFETWLGCMNGDPKAWDKLTRYNRQDVIILEELYLKMLPWVHAHPNMAAYNGKPNSCPKCGGGPLMARGWKYFPATRRRSFQCKNCGGYSTGRTIEKLETTAG